MSKGEFHSFPPIARCFPIRENSRLPPSDIRSLYPEPDGILQLSLWSWLPGNVAKLPPCCTINSLLLTCVISLFLEVRLDNFPTTHKGSNHPRVPSDHERSSKWKRFVQTWRKALFMFLLSGVQFVSQFLTYILQIINRLPDPRHYSNKLAIMLVWQNSFSNLHSTKRIFWGTRSSPKIELISFL
jgi:hypothetical protein